MTYTGPKALDDKPAPSPSQAAASPALPVVVKEQAVFKDKLTGEVIPWDKIHENMAAIDNLKQKLHQGRLVFRQALKETDGDHAEACKRSNAVAGGICSELWDQLSEQKVVCSLMVVCPPSKDKKEMYENEDRLRLAIGQVSGHMYSRIVDVWTSRKEIGTVSETFVYVRYPYHMWAQVEALATSISQLNVGTHHFKASLSLDARKKLQPRHGVQVQQWELQINGHNLPDLKKEDIDEMQEAAKGSFAEKFEKEMQVDAMEKAGMSPEMQCALQFLWDHEIHHMKTTETWRIFCMLSSVKDLTSMTGMFQFCGRVINAAEKASDPVMTSTVMCCEVKNAVKFPGSPLFYDLTHGDQFVTLDAPFVLNMGEHTLTKKDSEGGVAVIFCWRYHLGGENGVVLENAGLAFLQHLSYNRHLCNLLTLANLLQPQMSRFSTNIANMQADNASSSSAWTAIEQVAGEGHVAGSN